MGISVESVNTIQYNLFWHSDVTRHKQTKISDVLGRQAKLKESLKHEHMLAYLNLTYKNTQHTTRLIK